MTRPRLQLVVLRFRDLEAAVRFYGRLGLEFERERHGGGPEHYSCSLGQTVLELYPLAEGAVSSAGTRIGFQVADLDACLPALIQAGAEVSTTARPSPWGRRAVVRDPEGHAVELTESAT